MSMGKRNLVSATPTDDYGSALIDMIWVEMAIMKDDVSLIPFNISFESEKMLSARKSTASRNAKKTVQDQISIVNSHRVGALSTVISLSKNV